MSSIRGRQHRSINLSIASSYRESQRRQFAALSHRQKTGTINVARRRKPRTMFQFRLPTLFDYSNWTAPVISLPKVEVYDVDNRTDSSKRDRALRNLIRANHVNHSVIYNHLQFHNHTPHILGSAYIFGADADKLNHIYDVESKQLEPWKESPGEIAKHDWRDYLGKKEYQKAFVDFFEDQLVKHGYNWQSLLNEFLLEGDNPLINNLISGLGHPLIHLGYAYELNSRTVAIESLALVACFYDELHLFLDNPIYTRPSQRPSDSLFLILDRITHDKTFDGLFSHPGAENIDTLLANDEAKGALVEHWNEWDLTNPKDQFAESQKLAVALLTATESSQTDFYVCHLLTTSHAVRVLLPLLPAKWHIPLVRQWWLFTSVVYIAQMRPAINIDKIKLIELDGRDWKYVANKAITGKHSNDAHYVKAIRAMRDASKTWGDPNDFYLKAAVKFADEFKGWSYG